MLLTIAHRKEEDIAGAGTAGRSNAELDQIKAEMSALGAGMVLEIETGAAKAVHGTKGLVTRASKQLGRPFIHWHRGRKVFAKPAEARGRGRPPKAQS